MEEINRKMRFGEIVLFVILPILMILIFATGIVMGAQSAVQYTELHDKAISVEAVVSKHGTESDDNGEDYVSYISYTVNGVKYENIRYEKRDMEDSLDPIGSTVTIKVNPENPEELMSDIRFNARFYLTAAPAIILFGLLAFIKSGIVECSEDYVVDTVDEECIERCFKTTIKNRFWRRFFFVFTVYRLLLTLVFPLVFNSLIPVCITAVIYLVLLGIDLIRLMCIKTSRCSIFMGEFTEKYVTTNQDNETTYWIKYYIPDLQKSKSNMVSYGQYQNVREKDRCYLVFIFEPININKPDMNFYQINGKFIQQVK